MRPRRSSRGSSHEREQRLHHLPGKPGIQRERLIRAFLRPPPRHTCYREGHGFQRHIRLVAWASEGLSQRLIRLRAHSRGLVESELDRFTGSCNSGGALGGGLRAGCLVRRTGDPEVAFGGGGEGVEGADAVAGGGGQVGAYGAEGPGTGHGAHAAGDLDADLADTRLRQVTWPAIGKHHEYITAQLKAGVRMPAIHQRLRDEHGLAVSVQSLRRYVTANVPEETAGQISLSQVPQSRRGEPAAWA
jgi:hypothetical protein